MTTQLKTKKYRIEINNAPPELEYYIEELCSEYKVDILKREWVSIYNSFVRKKERPLVKDFELFVTLESEDREYLRFVKYLYDKRFKSVKRFNGLIGGDL